MSELRLQVNSEIGRLRSIFLHKPQDELHNMVPANMTRLLFDDLPDAQMAGEEYDIYLNVLRQNGVEIHFIEDLLAEAIDAASVKENFLREFFAVHQLDDPEQIKVLVDYFSDFDRTVDMVSKLIAGLRKEELPEYAKLFQDLNGEEDFFILDPLPNTYFTRDPFSVIGDMVSINSMYSQSRRPECCFGQYIFQYHPALSQHYCYQGERQQADGSEIIIEGGDILILREQVVAIGISQRTTLEGIMGLARTMFENGSVRDLETVLAVQIPSKRAFMHLDTVFTQLDRDCYVIHPGVTGDITVFEISRDVALNGKNPKEVRGSLDQILEKYTGVEKVRLIQCGGDSPVDAEREQWNDGANTLALAPGEVIVYERNHVTNQLMEEAGIKLHKLRVSELVRGRGGPHCMSQPMMRDLL